MPSFANPVPGYLHPPGWVRPPGNTDMRVTQTAAQHMSSQYHVAGPAALDIGDGDPDADAVYAVAAGTVNLVRNFDGAVEISHPDGWRTAYVHMRLPLEVRLGQVIAERQVIGHQGGTFGTTGVAVHLHFETKQLVNGVYVHRDPWPLLRQNQEDDSMIPVPVGSFTHLINKRTSVVATDANFRAERRLDAAVIGKYPQGTAFLPVASANDGSQAGGATPALWYGGFLFDDAPSGFIFGWFHSSVVGPLVDAAPGYNDADLNAAKKVAANIVSAAATAAASKF